MFRNIALHAARNFLRLQMELHKRGELCKTKKAGRFAVIIARLYCKRREGLLQFSTVLPAYVLILNKDKHRR